MNICSLCGESFAGRLNAKFCRNVRASECVHCGKSFEWICRKRVVSTCSAACAARARGAKVLGCVRCGESFKAAGGRKYCESQRLFECTLCGREFKRVCSRYSLKTQMCDSICWNLGPEFNVGLIHEYRAIDDWAVDFFSTRGRKPHVSDIRKYFGVRNMPTHASVDLFVPRASRSFFENMVVEAISRVSPLTSVACNTRPLREGGRIYEIDVLLPDLKIGIEVQDFATHDRVSDDVKGRFGLKHGPRYFAMKHRLAEVLGIRLVEVWEDEVLSSNFDSRLAALLDDRCFSGHADLS